MPRFLPFLGLLLMACMAWGTCNGQTMVPGRGMFWFNGYRPLANKPIRVYYYLPTGDNTRLPILMALHGDDRDAVGTLADWQGYAQANHFLVMAPEFSDSLYTGSNAYHLANMFTNGESPTRQSSKPDSVWTFAMVEALYSWAKGQLGTQATGYVAFGHSAGAQFLHRLHLLAPKSLAASFCANAGWYTLPDTTVKFPYGLSVTPATQRTLVKAFGLPLNIWLGEKDTSPTSFNLRHTPEADAQGLNRFTRGNYFSTYAQDQARRRAYTIRWTVSVARGIGHDNTGMARACAVDVIKALAATLAAIVDTAPLVPPLKLYVSGQQVFISGLSEGESFTLSLYNLQGQELLKTTSTASALPFEATMLPAGLYMAQVQVSGRPVTRTKIYLSR
jgi:hypothetical protein